MKSRNINAFNRLNNEMRQIIIGHPIVKIRLKKKPLLTVIISKIVHAIV